MNAIVDPEGADLCVVPSNPVPEGVRAGYFRTTDNVRLRYAIWPKGQGASKGTICLLQGRTEFIEKYFETVSDLRARGFAVATFDWRGQGGSDRLVGNRRLGYVDRFEDYLVDLQSFYAQILLPDCPPPFNLLAHSMGGLVALELATRDRSMFERMLLCAPMVSLDGLPLAMPAMASAFEALCFMGLGQVPLARAADRPPSDRTFPGNPLTSDLRRYMRSVEVLTARPELAVAAPSMRWLAAATRAMAEAAGDRFPARVRVPLLMLAAARDTVVSSPAIEHLGLRMRTGRHAVIPIARHEMLMENDAVRGHVFAAFEAFIAERTRD